MDVKGELRFVSPLLSMRIMSGRYGPRLEWLTREQQQELKRKYFGTDSSSRCKALVFSIGYDLSLDPNSLVSPNGASPQLGNKNLPLPVTVYLKSNGGVGYSLTEEQKQKIARFIEERRPLDVALQRLQIIKHPVYADGQNTAEFDRRLREHADKYSWLRGSGTLEEKMKRLEEMQPGKEVLPRKSLTIMLYELV